MSKSSKKCPHIVIFTTNNVQKFKKMSSVTPYLDGFIDFFAYIGHFFTKNKKIFFKKICGYRYYSVHLA